MTRIDFYVLQDSVPTGRERLACRLADKAFRLGHKTYVLTAGADASRALDELLWTFSAGSFVPHAVCTDETIPPALATEPVVIGHAEPPSEFHGVLINMASQTPSWFSRFERIAEVIGPDAQEKAHARERYRYYRDRGYSLKTHAV